MNITYEKNGDYLIPNLISDPEPEGELRKFGLMRRHYLKEHRSGIYQAMLLSGKLKEHLLMMQEQAEAQFDLLVKQMAEDGHLIGNHTWSHVDVTKMSDKQACEEITKTSELVRSIVGYDTEYIRPPFGAWNKNLECGFEMFPVLWTIDPLDWKTENADQIVEKVMSEAKENAIILLHDRYEASVEAALRIVDLLKEQGYTFVTADKLVLE